MIASHDSTAVKGFGEEDHIHKVSPHIISRAQIVNVTVDVDLDHLAEVIFMRFLHCTALPPSLHCTLEGSHDVQPTPEWGILLHVHESRVSTCIGIILHRTFDLSLLSQLFIYSVIYLCQYGLRMFTFYIEL